MYFASANRACSLIYSYIKKHTYNDGVWLVPVNVCPDVPLTFCSANIKFEFVDISPYTLCMDENECLRLIKNNPQKYSGIVFVRTYGYVYETSDFCSRVHSISSNINIVDDRCLCIPEFFPKTFGADMVLYSTGHCKQIDLGAGGYAFYSKKESFEIDETLVYDGTDEELLYKEAFSNKRPLCKIPQGWLKLDYFKSALEYWTEIETKIATRITHRELINNVYRDLLPNDIQMPNKFQLWRFNIVVPSEEKFEILQTLFNQGLFASNHYHSANRLFDHKEYINSDNVYNSTINLFNDYHYTKEMAKKTANIINKILK